MSPKKLKAVALVLLVVVSIAGVFALALLKKDAPPPPTPPPAQQYTAATEVSYRGVEGKDALQLLKAAHTVSTKNYQGIGEMVISINGVLADQTHFWALYVNGAQSPVGAAQYITKSSDQLQWKLEEIK